MQGSTAVECEVLNVIQSAGIWPDCDDKTQLLQAIETLIAGGGSGGGGVIAGSEIGSVSAFAMPTPPTGWLVCDGSAISRTEYADLFATIGTLWGDGDGSTTFNLPQLYDFLRGYNASSGLAVGTWQDDAIKAHSHIVTAGASSDVGLGAIVGGAENSVEASVNTSEVGGSETVPKHNVVLFAIKAFYPSAS
ncbi:tail fiber protein [Thalassospira sp. HF15]|uniref:phage tail protein n=1 Tax=Thalassospira sp. HF15 TaxID=2722755 RepID=UPI0014312BD3|nr:phage tail protein [Thalassospira sp. HF15]NIY76964.1 tail fiber protein [Thalassospira sp. HF15]